MLITEISNIDLARLLIRVIWQIYDNFGISLGRSREAFLLEATMFLISQPSNCKEFTDKMIVKEARHRVYFGEPQDITIREDFFNYSKQRLFDFGPAGLSNLELALFILIELKQEMLDPDSQAVLRGFFVISLVKNAYILLASETRTFFEKSFSIDDALAEAKTRFFNNCLSSYDL